MNRVIVCLLFAVACLGSGPASAQHIEEANRSMQGGTAVMTWCGHIQRVSLKGIRATYELTCLNSRAR